MAIYHIARRCRNCSIESSKVVAQSARILRVRLTHSAHRATDEALRASIAPQSEIAFCAAEGDNRGVNHQACEPAASARRNNSGQDDSKEKSVMFCPHCGTESIPGYKYCKRCGVNFAAPAEQSSKQRPVKQTGAAWAVALATVAITLGGLGIVFGTAASLLEPALIGQLTPIILTILVFGSLTVFGAVALLIRLFTRLMTGAKDAPTQAEIPVYTQARLSEPPASIPSVTENTTRNFEARYRQPLERE
jgi:hypothetical protein